MKKGVCGAVAAVALMLVGAPSASAAVTIGSDVSSGTVTSTACTGCTAIMVAHPSAQVASPIDGVVVRFRIRKGTGSAGTFSLRILRPVGGGAFSGVGTSPAMPTAGTPVVVEFPVRLPIRVGDHIGVDGSEMYLTRMVTGSITGVIGGGHPDGAPPAVPAVPFANDALMLNADIEPDCDSDGFGDETQDPELPLSEACGKGNRSLTLDANKNRVKKGKKVTLSGGLNPAARQGPCETAQTVELQRKKPSQASFATLAQVQTDAQGSFSLRQKVRKTFEFRAQVVETSACTAALSNTEKVKVEKRKR